MASWSGSTCRISFVKPTMHCGSWSCASASRSSDRSSPKKKDDNDLPRRSSMKVQRLVPPTMMKPLGSYCQSTRRGNIVATAGVAAVDRDGKVVGGSDIVAQTRATLDNLKLALEAAGASISD